MKPVLLVSPRTRRNQKKCYTESKDLRDKDNESHISSNWGFIFSTLNSSGALYAFDG